MKKIKAISPVVAIALLLVVSVVAVVGYQQWYQGYQSILTTDVEQRSTTSGSVNIEYISSDGTLYVTNSGNSNTTMGSLEISGSECIITDDLIPGVNKVDISSCLNNTGTNDIVIVTDSGIIEESLFVEEINSGSSSIVIAGNLAQTLDNANGYGTSAGDEYGDSVSISDSYAIVGAWYEEDAGDTYSGKAYIYDTSDGSLLYTLDNPNNYSTGFGDYFGSSVSISNSYAIVGAFQEDDAGGTNSGKAYIYDTSDGSLSYTLDNPNPYSTSVNDYFGYSVSISDSYVIVGAYGEDDAGGSGSGKAYIYDTSDGSLLHVLDNPNNYSTSDWDTYGQSVSISNSYAIVGAYGEDDAGGTESGKAYIYDTSDGSLLYTLDNPNPFGTSASDEFGHSVSISNSYAIVGAYYEDDAGGSSSGKAYIYDTSDGSLLYTLDNPNPYSTSAVDFFGYSVSISNSYAIVGGFAEDDAGGSTSGKAYIYDTSDGSLLYTLDNPNPYGTSAGDQFGYSVSISNSYAIVGADYEDDAGGTESGKAYIFS